MTGRSVAAWSAGAAVWTFIAWGNRVGLLTGDERSDPWTWIRVGGSLAFGLTLAIVAVMLWRGASMSKWMAVAFISFGALMLVVWLRSAISVLGGDDSIGFKVVHVVLATLSIGFGVVLGRIGLSRLRS